MVWPRVAFGGWSPSEDDETALVLIELFGGNDGLSTVIPYADDAYHAARKTTRFLPDEVLRLDDYRGLHPSLVNLNRAWDRGELAIVEGVGYPNPSRSHFTSSEIWGAGSGLGKYAGDGWASKLLAAHYGDNFLATRAVHVGGKLPHSLRAARHPALCIDPQTAYKWARSENEIAGLADASSAPEDSARGRLYSVLQNAIGSSRDLRDAVARHKPAVAYPDLPLAETLRMVSAVLHGGMGCRIASVQFAGFDTHVGQRLTHDSLIAELDASLGAFLEDLSRSARGKRTLVMVHSEFGRRVVENDSLGTDHGAAAPMFLLGAPVKGGLYGSHPSLTELHDGDMVYTTDFRRIYASVIRDWFAVDPSRVLDEKFLPLSVLAT